MQTSTQQPESFITCVLVILVLVIVAAEFNGMAKQFANQTSRCFDTSIFRRDVDLDASCWIDGQFFAFVDRSTEAWIVFASIFVIGIVLDQSVGRCPRNQIVPTYLWIVNVLLGSVTTQSICGDLELTSGIAKGDEGKTPEQDTNGLGGELF